MGGKRSKQELTQSPSAAINILPLFVFVFAICAAAKPVAVAELLPHLAPTPILALESAIFDLLPVRPANLDIVPSHITFSTRVIGNPAASAKSEPVLQKSFFSANFSPAIVPDEKEETKLELLAVYNADGALLEREFGGVIGEFKYAQALAGHDDLHGKVRFSSRPLGPAIEKKPYRGGSYAEIVKRRVFDDGGFASKGSLIAFMPYGKHGGAMTIRLDFSANSFQFMPELARFVFARALDAAFEIDTAFLKQGYLDYEARERLNFSLQDGIRPDSPNVHEHSDLEVESGPEMEAEIENETEMHSGYESEN